MTPVDCTPGPEPDQNPSSSHPAHLLQACCRHSCTGTEAVKHLSAEAPHLWTLWSSSSSCPRSSSTHLLASMLSYQEKRQNVNNSKGPPACFSAQKTSDVLGPEHLHVSFRPQISVSSCHQQRCRSFCSSLSTS